MGGELLGHDQGLLTLLPLFPLPNVVLFPGVLLPLHIFEPRYRTLVADALETDRRLGMVLLKPGWESDYDGRPPIHTIGCSGVIVHATQLEDGRYNMVLRGLERFRVLDEDHTRVYRRATIVELTDGPLQETERAVMTELRARLDAWVARSDQAVQAMSGSQTILKAMPDADLVHTLAQQLDLAPIEKQAVLERDSLRSRAELLLDLLEMKRLEASMPTSPNVLH